MGSATIQITRIHLVYFGFWRFLIFHETNNSNINRNRYAYREEIYINIRGDLINKISIYSQVTSIH